MKGSEKILLLIVVAVIVLVVVAFALVLLRPEPEYVSAATPEGVVHNYLLGLRRKDYEEAFSYLSEDLKVKDLDLFIDAVESDRWRFNLDNDVTLIIEETKMTSDDAARVQVRRTSSNNSLFGGGGYSDTFTLRLENEEGGWKIYDSDSPYYWDDCWDRGSECD